MTIARCKLENCELSFMACSLLCFFCWCMGMMNGPEQWMGDGEIRVRFLLNSSSSSPFFVTSHLAFGIRAEIAAWNKETHVIWRLKRFEAAIFLLFLYSIVLCSSARRTWYRLHGIKKIERKKSSIDYCKCLYRCVCNVYENLLS